MAGSPPTHSSADEESAGLYALDLLEGQERRDFERHFAECGHCQAIVEADRRTLGRLAAAAPELEPSPDLKERLLRRAAQELSGQSPAATEPRAPLRPEPVRWRSWPRPLSLLPVAALLLVAVGLGVALGQQWYAGQVVASVALMGNEVPGSTTVTVRRSGLAEVHLSGLPDPPPGHVYQVWTIPAGGQPIPAGAHRSGDGTVRLTTPTLGRTVAITIEPSAGRASPSSPPILSANVSA